MRAWLEYGHQYNVHAREMMYSWFLKHLAGKDEDGRRNRRSSRSCRRRN